MMGDMAKPISQKIRRVLDPLGSAGINSLEPALEPSISVMGENQNLKQTAPVQCLEF
jgi:hypothetical protein